MNKQQTLDAVQRKERPEQLDWLLRLATDLTVAARASYPAAGGNIEHLIGFNEMQNRIHSYLRHPETADEWPIAQLFDTLLATAAHYGIEGDFRWAVRNSLRIPS